MTGNGMGQRGVVGMSSRIAILSNINMNYMSRLLRKEHEVWDSEGYGNELGTLMNPASSYHSFAPQITFLIMDLMELIGHELDHVGAGAQMDSWFGMLEAALQPEGIYYVSDAYLWGPELSVVWDPGRRLQLEHLWQEKLQELRNRHANVFILPYRQVVTQLGEENTFSLKMWYLGKILHTNEAQKKLAELVSRAVLLQKRTAKKVLALDLDNTLWGGLAGEAEHTPIQLSEDHRGLAYKNLQRVILQMQKQGVLLVIVSKNNEADAMEILEKHPHCVLRPSCFAAKRINWQPKHENLLELATELNLGIDSFVFWDDNPTERELVRTMLPQVTVPDFPEKPESLAGVMAEIYRSYFEKAVLTEEDLMKTESYAANAARNRLQAQTVDFSAYLKQLEIVIVREDPVSNVRRLTEFVNKTNQFNLTTQRYEQQEMQQILADAHKRVFLYRVKDRFGDNGIVAAAIVDIAEIPVIEELVMSCRVMGKNIEYAIVEDIENQLFAEGFERMIGVYRPTAKNKPVEELYDRLGYSVVTEDANGDKEYEIAIEGRPVREYAAVIQE